MTCIGRWQVAYTILRYPVSRCPFYNVKHASRFGRPDLSKGLVDFLPPDILMPAEPEETVQQKSVYLFR
jgi:hypothetical protein